VTPGGPKKLVVGAALGDCVHVAGIVHFLSLAEAEGFRTEFLGPAQPVDAVVEAIDRLEPSMVGVSYRLSPEAIGPLLDELSRKLAERASRVGRPGPVMVFGGTEPVCRVARESGLFARVFSPRTDPGEVVDFLRRAARGEVAVPTPGSGRPGRPTAAADREAAAKTHPDNLVDRIAAARPYPIFRHHYGRPSLEETVRGCALLAESGVLDVISIGPDQNAQEHFFHPEEMEEDQTGAGGVPLRRPEDFRRLYEASRRGNHPLMRCYSGTRDILRMARMLRETIRNAWCAVPLFWYNVLDGRSRRALPESIRENMEVVAWHAEQGVPVEVNESHHWSLREAPDAVAVAAAFLAAYNAKRRGVRHYVSQYMFNTPAGTWPDMDLGKMLAKIDLIEGLHDETFTSFRQVRAGLASFPADLDEAKGHLAAVAFLQMSLSPHILHVVGYSEADHAARAEEVVESVKIARGAVRAGAAGLPDMTSAPTVKARREELVAEARVILDAVRELAGPGVEDPWADPDTLARAVRTGVLDAPHLAGNPAACGQVRTRIIDGRCVAVDPRSGRPVEEKARVREALDRALRKA